MIDYIKIKVTDSKTIVRLWNNPLLYFYSKNEFLLFDNETIKTRNTKQFNGILFELTEHVLYIRFKPHYFFNSNIHNANDFSVKDCIEILKQFSTLFKLETKYLEVINIEFGLNIIIPDELICVKDLLAYTIYHGLNEFRTDRKYIYCKFSHSSNKRGAANVYKMVKMYAKGIQFPKNCNKNTLRFEIKSNRKKYINRLDIYTIEDLLQPQRYNNLKNVILKEFDDILIIDSFTTPKINKRRLNKHLERLNPIHWHKLLNRSRNVFKNHFNAYYKDLNTSRTHLKAEIRNLIANKLIELQK
ncbi:hypothetical protein PW52_00450 [Tamlana sedimentorum]|uniref:Uncharacterized protein n=1 Tax=Neotamlana sedimentorum TaxID=1435349 RepID=A0A0D7WCS4_9FLAO|nr:hypothetical protein [Tamlana sedimentorum]KJD36965.1 hypothetical protein PW52_00450 [Tamlana sedimentorum]